MADALEGVALVTGGGRGIGRAIAERLATDGMRVAVAARTKSEVEEAAEATGGLPLTLDVTDAEAVERAVDLVEHKLGPIDLLVNNAGALEPGGPAWEREPDEWWRVFEVNVLGPFLSMRAAMSRMIGRGRGRIVNALDALSGRHIDARVDDWKALPSRSDEILENDLLALRLRR